MRKSVGQAEHGAATTANWDTRVVRGVSRGHREYSPESKRIPARGSTR